MVRDELGVLCADAASLTDAIALRPHALFLMDDAVTALHLTIPLLESGTDVIACATDAARFSVTIPPGIVPGSQHDHARLVSTSTRFAAFTPIAHPERSTAGAKSKDAIAVRLTRSLSHPKSHQALRTAVAYAAYGLHVVVRLDHLDDPSPSAARALATLRALGHAVGPTSDTPPADLEIAW